MPTTKQTGRLPNFIIIGAPKAGTTSLHFYLSLHPEIFMPKVKELNFFTAHPMSSWTKGIEWYSSLFRSEKTVCGEASAGYAWKEVNPCSAERMHRVVPSCKLIYCMRQPYDRLVSHFEMDCRRGVFSGNFEEFLSHSKFGLARYASYYGRQLEEFLRYFDRSQIHFVETSQMDRARTATLQGVFKFLGVDASFESIMFRHKRYVGRRQPFPTKQGRAIMQSGVLRFLESAMSPQVFYHFRNLLLLPFSEPTPSLALPGELTKEITADFAREVQSVRKLAGLDLASLGFHGGP